MAKRTASPATLARTRNRMLNYRGAVDAVTPVQPDGYQLLISRSNSNYYLGEQMISCGQAADWLIDHGLPMTEDLKRLGFPWSFRASPIELSNYLRDVPNPFNIAKGTL